MTVLSLLPFPPLAWWHALQAASGCLLDTGEPFRKMGCRNRYRLASSNGPLWLTIPIVGGREQRTPVGEITIDNRQPWQRSHWRTIGSIYRRTPFFEHYEPSLHPLFHAPYESLAAFNADSIRWCLKALRLPEFPEIRAVPAPVEGLTDQRERWLQPDHFPSKAYTQPFEDRTGFLRGMSVLDILFNEGPAANAYFQ